MQPTLEGTGEPPEADLPQHSTSPQQSGITWRALSRQPLPGVGWTLLPHFQPVPLTASIPHGSAGPSPVACPATGQRATETLDSCLPGRSSGSAGHQENLWGGLLIPLEKAPHHLGGGQALVLGLPRAAQQG